MTKKYIAMILGICLCLGLLTACGGEEPPTEQTDPNTTTTETQEAESDLAERYSLETDKILIVTDYDITKFEPYKMKTIEITDSEEIAAVQESVNFDAWVDMAGEAAAGMYQNMVIFNDDFALRFYDGMSDCYIGSYEITEDGLYQFVPSENDHLYRVAPEFTEMLRGYCE